MRILSIKIFYYTAMCGLIFDTRDLIVENIAPALLN